MLVINVRAYFCFRLKYKFKKRNIICTVIMGCLLGAGLIQGFCLCTLGGCTLGFGSLNHGIWSLLIVFGAQKPRVPNIKGTNLKSLTNIRVPGQGINPGPQTL